MRKTELILALDVNSRQQAMRWVNLLYPKVTIFKVGLQLYTACGPKIIQDIRKTGAEVFLDLKFNDIPNTMANATRELLKYQVAMFTVHTLSGPDALKEVAQACRGSRAKALGVTVLTSISSNFLKDLKIQRSLSQEVLYLAKMAKKCGMSGVVCSVPQAKIIRKYLCRNFIIVCPGIRPAGSSRGDQQQIATPQAAKDGGADYIVVGRPILEARRPLAVTESILRDIS
ncbi:MAG: orotidine-5'-phosphate decarboxylase [Candidatus Omnitrophica bacterium]|nr:orotidine-5'-phosphate decarboxylase [Candidatus Omnitrophota bacterium]